MSVYCAAAGIWDTHPKEEDSSAGGQAVGDVWRVRKVERVKLFWGRDRLRLRMLTSWKWGERILATASVEFHPIPFQIPLIAKSEVNNTITDLFRQALSLLR